MCSRVICLTQFSNGMKVLLTVKPGSFGSLLGDEFWTHSVGVSLIPIIRMTKDTESHSKCSIFTSSCGIEATPAPSHHGQSA